MEAKDRTGETTYACVEISVTNTESQQRLPATSQFTIRGQTQTFTDHIPSRRAIVDEFNKPIEGDPYLYLDDGPDANSAVSGGTSKSGWVVFEAQDSGFGTRGAVDFVWNSRENTTRHWEVEFETQ
jgi:hypothetical protein